MFGLWVFDQNVEDFLGVFIFVDYVGYSIRYIIQVIMKYMFKCSKVSYRRL